jgi:glycosyltransferase involved in cell wall biosynthesis
MNGGGAERVQLAIMRHLVDAGHEVHLVLAHEGGVLMPLVPREVRVIPLRAKRLFATLPGLVGYLRKEKPWSLHAVMWPCTVLAVAAKMIARVKTRLLLVDHVALSKQYPAGRQQAMLRATLGFFYPRADHVAAVSHGAAANTERLAGMPPGSVETIYNPMHLPAELPAADPGHTQWRDGAPRLVTLGRLDSQKNHDLLLRAFHKLLEVHPDATLLILGEGSLRGQLEQARHDLGLDRRAMLPGFAVDPWPLLVSADLFVLSSDYEGLPLVLVEAMHAGLRIVSTDCVTGPSELLDDGKYGRLVPVGDEDALARAMIEELEAPRQPERQRARAQEIVGARNLERYEDLLAS